MHQMADKKNIYFVINIEDVWFQSHFFKGFKPCAEYKQNSKRKLPVNQKWKDYLVDPKNLYYLQNIILKEHTSISTLFKNSTSFNTPQIIGNTLRNIYRLTVHDNPWDILFVQHL